jgi:D-cysteine desulfhydrase
MPLPRLALCHAPTPLRRYTALDRWIGCKVWVKRDDMTGGAEAGNKIRKLEFLLADALAKKATAVLTCGGIQSNHARATALACAELGLRSVLFLRVKDDAATGPSSAAPRERLPLTGNVLLDRMAGTDLRLISPADYADRAALMETEAIALSRKGEVPYVIPEGGSNGLGSMGYVETMRELRAQMDLGLAGAPKRFDVAVMACGSGGTAAGTALGAARFGVADLVRAYAVCDDKGYFERVAARIIGEARAYGDLGEPTTLAFDDSAKGPAYGVMSPEQKRFVVATATKTGLVTDPVYTGKALFGLKKAVEAGKIPSSAKVLFLHTGGLPGLLAQGSELEQELS